MQRLLEVFYFYQLRMQLSIEIHRHRQMYFKPKDSVEWRHFRGESSANEDFWCNGTLPTDNEALLDADDDEGGEVSVAYLASWTTVVLSSASVKW
jgi:hypothetical protein